MTKYYGVFVSELSGEVDNLEGDYDYKPSHESCGFSFAKWFTDKSERDETCEYMKNEISNIRKNRRER